MIQFLLLAYYRHRYIDFSTCGKTSLNLRDPTLTYPMHRGISDTRGWEMQICSFSWRTNGTAVVTRWMCASMHIPRGYKCTRCVDRRGWTSGGDSMPIRAAEGRPSYGRAHVRTRERRLDIERASEAKALKTGETDSHGKGARRTSGTWQFHRPRWYSVTPCTFDSELVYGCMSFAPSSRQIPLTSSWSIWQRTT